MRRYIFFNASFLGGLFYGFPDILACLKKESFIGKARIDRQQPARRDPLGDLAVDELAHAVMFLLDERAAYVTGSVVTVDGGLSMGG